MEQTLAQIMAQAGGVDMGSIDIVIAMLNSFGPTGFVIWMLHRTTTVTFPRMIADFKESIERQRVDFKDSLESQRQDYIRNTERDREIIGKQIEAMTDAIKHLDDRIDKMR